MPFNFIETALQGVLIIEPKVFADQRGFFLETYKASDFRRAGITEELVQHNHSKSSRHVLRGLHYQLKPHAQGKLIRCISGSILDVAVDIRKGSITFGRWISELLSEDNFKMLYIPEGFAHGFIVLSDTAEIIYSCTAEYDPAYDRGILWNDPDIAIEWPTDDPVLSAKDISLPRFRDAENNFFYLGGK